MIAWDAGDSPIHDVIRPPATFLAPILISCLFPVYLALLSTYAILSCSLLYSSFRTSTYRCNPPTRVPYDTTFMSPVLVLPSLFIGFHRV